MMSGDVACRLSAPLTCADSPSSWFFAICEGKEWCAYLLLARVALLLLFDSGKPSPR
jgi:hypothetical protein